MTSKQMEESGLMLPVASLAINYKNSAHYDEVLKVKTQLKNIPTALIEFFYELADAKGKLLATGSTVFAFIDTS